MKNLMNLLSAIALAMTAIYSQAQNSESKPQPTFTYQVTNVENDFRNLIIEGIVRNTGHTPINWIFVKSIGYNRNREIVGTGNDIPVSNFSLEANQTVHFRTEILNNTEQVIVSYSLSFDAHSPDVSPTPFVVSATPEPTATPFVVPATPEPNARPASMIYYRSFPSNASPTPVATWAS